VYDVAELFFCPDCEQPSSLLPDSLCPACSSWRDGKLAEMDEDWREQQERLRRLRMSSGERFSEMLADLAKLPERTTR
jgi:hypothetical protein